MPGKIVESAKPEVIFNRPKHPYTIGLLNSMPGRRAPKKRLEAIPGMVPNPLRLADGLPVPRPLRARRRAMRADAAAAGRDREAPPRRLFHGCVRWRCSKSAT